MTTAARNRRIAVLLSGRGSNFEAIADAVADGRIPNAEIAAVVSDVPGAKGLSRARMRGLRAFAVDRGQYASREAHEQTILRILEAAETDLVCLAGYMIDNGGRALDGLGAFPGYQIQPNSECR